MAARMVEAGRELVEAGRAWQWELPTVQLMALRTERWWVRRKELPMALRMAQLTVPQRVKQRGQLTVLRRAMQTARMRGWLTELPTVQLMAGRKERRTERQTGLPMAWQRVMQSERQMVWQRAQQTAKQTGWWTVLLMVLPTVLASLAAT